METVYITKAKIEALIKLLDIDTDYNYKDLIYHARLVEILAKPEMKTLLNFKSILEGIDNIPVYNKENTRKYKNNYVRMVYVGGKPSFHKDKNCQFLKSNYENYEIPAVIPDNKIEEYREFFIDNKTLYESKRDAFFARVEIKFNVRVNNVKEINEKNSGVEYTEDITTRNIDETIKSIESHLIVMEKFRAIDDNHEKKISSLGYGTHKANYKNENGELKLFINDSNSIIYKWHEYKNELKHLIKQYFIAKYNPDFEFNKSVLRQCGFVPCKGCYK